MAFLEFSIGLVMFLFASSQLLAKNRSSIHYFMALVCYCGAYLLAYLWSAENGFVLPAALWASDISIMFLFVPTFYLASTAVLSGGAKAQWRIAPLLIPSALFFIGFGAYNSIARPRDAGLPGDSPGHFSNPLLSWLSMAGFLSFAVAIVICLFVAYRIHASGKVVHPKIFRTQVVFLIAYLGCALSALYGCLTQDREILRFAILSDGLIAVGFTLTVSTIRYFPADRPDRGQASTHKRDWDLDSVSLSKRLDRLMESAAPYRDASLTLDKLAQMLGEDPRRLTYHFKTCLSTNFRGYINGLRLKTICRDLVERLDVTILTIAFENGFNSKSSFNTLFYRTYGVTPHVFRSRPATRSLAEGAGSGNRPTQDR